MYQCSARKETMLPIRDSQALYKECTGSVVDAYEQSVANLSGEVGANEHCDQSSPKA